MPKQSVKRTNGQPQSTDQQLGTYQELSESFVSVPLSSEPPPDSHSPFVLEDEELFSSALRHQNEQECSSESQVDNLFELLGSSDGGGVSKEDIRVLLDIYDGDVDRVASCLLEQDFSSLQLVKDFQLAHTLQEEEQRHSTRFIQQQEDDTTTYSGTPLPASSRERFIHSVKEILIPQLANELVGMHFPDIENDGQKYEYHLRNLSLELLNIPIDRVQVTVTHPDIHVDCEDVELKIAVGHWEYHRKVVFMCSQMYRFSGRSAFSICSQLKKNVEAVLQTTVSSAVDSQLNQWTQWIFAQNE
ncbi:hypothetical protein Gasu2_07490 [Galdieria sulphuraria]|nr:hypothetical protein Gasu2_07490 [Galdieria sulphuraria]